MSGSIPASSCGSRASRRTTLDDVARTDYILARPTDTMFDLIGRLARRGARLVIVVRAAARIPRAADVVGVIGLETMGEAVIDNARAFAPSVVAQPVPAALSPPRHPPGPVLAPAGPQRRHHAEVIRLRRARRYRARALRP